MIIARSIPAEPCSKQSQLDPLRFRAIAAAYIRMADADLANHFAKDVCKVVTIIDIR